MGLFEEKTPDYLFHITDNGNGTFNVQNVKYLDYVDTYSQARQTVLMTAEQQTGQTFKYLGKERWYISNTTDIWLTIYDIRPRHGRFHTSCRR